MNIKKISFTVIFSIFFLGAFAQTNWYVSQTGDDASGNGSQSSPWATITKALGSSSVVNGDTINVSGTITQSGLSAAGIDILKNVIIKGEDKETSIVQADTSTFSATSRVFTNWSIVKIMNLTIRNGYFDALSPQYGAGILNWGILTLENCNVTDNAIENEERGGGIYNEFGVLYLNNTYVYSNYSNYGGAGIVCEGGSLNIENSTIALNYTQHNLAVGGGILMTDTAHVDIRNSTIYYNLMGNNSFGAGIGILTDNTHIGTVVLNLLNVTIADNEAGDGSAGLGLYVENNSPNSINIAIKNCIISNSDTSNFFQTGIGAGVVTVLRSHTLCKDATLTGGGAIGNLNNTDPMIDTFGDNGGLTLTASLKANSPAINAGTDDGAPQTDQRGMPRKGITDMGAYEYQIVDTVTAINFNKNQNIRIFPNPAQNYISIVLPDNLTGFNRVIITDITGKEILQSNKAQCIDISGVSAGVYMLKIETKNNIYTRKFIKK